MPVYVCVFATCDRPAFWSEHIPQNPQAGPKAPNFGPEGPQRLVAVAEGHGGAKERDVRPERADTLGEWLGVCSWSAFGVSPLRASTRLWEMLPVSFDHGYHK